MRDPITVDDVLNARMIAYPFTLLMCCLVTDGGGAIILSKADRAKDMKQKPVYIIGTGEGAETTMVSQMKDFTSSQAFRLSGAEAFRTSGINHDDVDHLMIYDAFAHLPLYGLEDLGFCEPRRGRGLHPRAQHRARRQAAHEHQWRGAELLPHGHVRHVRAAGKRPPDARHRPGAGGGRKAVRLPRSRRHVRRQRHHRVLQRGALGEAEPGAAKLDGVMETDSVSPLAAVAILIKLILVPYLIHALLSGLVSRRIGWSFSRGFLLAIAPTMFPFLFAAIMMTFPELHDAKIMGIERRGMVLFMLGSLFLVLLFFQMTLLHSNLPAYVFASDKIILLLAAALSFPMLGPAFSALWLVASFGNPNLRGIAIKAPSEPTSFRKNVIVISVPVGLTALLFLASYYDLAWQLWITLIVLSAIWWVWQKFRK